MADQPNHSEARERRLILFLCLLAAFHVFVFSATFPFFNNVDEQSHIDLAVRYSSGDIPRTVDWFSPDSRPYLVAYSSLAYIWPPQKWPRDVLLYYPAWKQPLDKVRRQFLDTDIYFKQELKNKEDSQPPLYYALVGAWWRVGRLLQFEGLSLLYWLRFLNLLLVAGLVWLSWQTARHLFPQNQFIRMAVPALIALLPQTIFYSINNDVLSPLTFGAAFLLWLKFRAAQPPSRGLGAAFGLALAATFLTKMSNLPLIFAAGLFLAVDLFAMARTGKLGAARPALGLLVTCAALPTAAWMGWCRLNFGDFTGSAAKVAMLRWTSKPVSEWFHHPMFTPHGFWSFASRNCSTFWQGELEWHGQPLAIGNLDLFYVLLTFAVLLFAFIALLRAGPQISSEQRRALWLGFACGAGMLVFVAFLSIKYDFHECQNPSRQFPFFVSGRLWLGMLIPFMLLFAFGLDQAMKKMAVPAKILVLAVLLLFVLISEITVDLPIFPNPGNWYHLNS